MGNTTSYAKFGDASPHLQYLAQHGKQAQKGNNVCLSGIVCTIGPGSTDENILVDMMRAGMRVARLNFSHGSHAEHADRIKTIRKAMQLYEQKYNQTCPLAIALDTKGPEIRTGIIEQGERSKVELKQGSLVKLTNKHEHKNKCTDKMIYITSEMLLREIQVNQEIYVDDGKIILKCVRIEDDFVVECEVVNGGMLGSKKGVTLPGFVSGLSIISEDDEKDLKFAVEHGLDIIFASFIKVSADILDIRKVLGEAGKNILIIPKIETAQAVKDIDHIIKKSDGVMVARGDLALQIPVEQVFSAQKQIIAHCNIEGKPVICATQMLESMMDKRRPSRADVSDIGNAIFDGADCVMLSGETAVGKYPVECVQTMAKVCSEAERFNWNGRIFHELQTLTFNNDGPDGFCMSAVTAATFYDAGAIIVTSDLPADFVKLVSKFKPKCPIIAVSKDVKCSRQIGLYRAVFSVVCEETSSEQTAVTTVENIRKELRCAVDYGLKKGILQRKDSVVILGKGEFNVADDAKNVKIEVVQIRSVCVEMKML